jgi:hypothetical protein
MKFKSLLTFLLLQATFSATAENSAPVVMELGNRVGGMDAFSTELCKILNPGWRQAE